MKTVNSISGGKSSCYIGLNYPADYNVFSLVRTNDKLCEYPDKKIRQIVSDKIGCEFVGTLEQDNIIRIMLDMSEQIDITWLTGLPFEQLVKNKKDYLPNVMARYCTTELKMKPLFDWWEREINEVCSMSIGFRSGEEKRQQRVLEKLNDNGTESIKVVIGKHPNGNNAWGLREWRKPTFPLIEDNIKQNDIQNYWKNNKSVYFKEGYYNNCVGCFHRNPLFLNKMAQEHKNKMEFFAQLEEKTNSTFVKNLKYRDIVSWKPQGELSFDDFNECDSGFCGL